MKLLVNKEITSRFWGNILKDNRFSSPFQSLSFYEFFNSLDDFSADVFAIEEDGELTSLVVITIQKEKGLKGYFSRRGIVYGGPLVKESDIESLSYLLSKIVKFYKRKLIYLEIRNSFDYNAFKEVFSHVKWKYNPHLNVQLSLIGKSLEDILKSMTYNRRREVKISFQEGASVSVTSSIEETIQVYNILNELYKTRVKLPLPSKEYFVSFLNFDITKVFVVKHNDNVIGGSFCITDNKNSINTLYYAGLRDYHKKIFPTHLAVIGVIQYGIDNNIGMVDFMGAGKPNVPYGVRDFKLQFGGDLVEHGRYLKVINPLLYKVGIIGLKVLSKIKK
jgi:serine/alanine adding enzyme